MLEEEQKEKFANNKQKLFCWVDIGTTKNCVFSGFKKMNMES